MEAKNLVCELCGKVEGRFHFCEICTTCNVVIVSGGPAHACQSVEPQCAEEGDIMADSCSTPDLVIDEDRDLHTTIDFEQMSSDFDEPDEIIEAATGETWISLARSPRRTWKELWLSENQSQRVAANSLGQNTDAITLSTQNKSFDSAKPVIRLFRNLTLDKYALQIARKRTSIATKKNRVMRYRRNKDFRDQPYKKLCGQGCGRLYSTKNHLQDHERRCKWCPSCKHWKTVEHVSNCRREYKLPRFQCPFCKYWLCENRINEHVNKKHTSGWKLKAHPELREYKDQMAFEARTKDFDDYKRHEKVFKRFLEQKKRDVPKRRPRKPAPANNDLRPDELEAVADNTLPFEYPRYVVPSPANNLLRGDEEFVDGGHIPQFVQRAILLAMNKDVPVDVYNAFFFGLYGWLPHWIINFFLGVLTRSNATNEQRLWRALQMIERFRDRFFNNLTAKIVPSNQDDEESPKRRDKGKGKSSSKGK